MSRWPIFSFICPLALALLTAAESPAGKPAAKQPTKESSALLKVRAIRALLDEPIDAREMLTPMTLKEALGLLSEKLNARWKGEDVLAVLVDVAAFKEETPDAPDIYDTQVKLPPFPRRMTAAMALRLMLSKVVTNNATFLVRDGFIEVTTYERAALTARLGERVEARFEQVPLAEALRTLAEEKGIAIVVDTRQAWRTKALVTADLRQGVSLQTALYILADMAGLRGVATSDLLYFTSPEHALRLVRETGGAMVPLPPGAMAPLLPGAPPHRSAKNEIFF